MEIFTNEVTDINNLPKYEEVQFTNLHPLYWKVILVKIMIISIASFSVLGFIMYFDVTYNKGILNSSDYKFQKFAGLLIIILMYFFFSKLSFKKKGFAFRNHDVLYRHGLIATNTIIIPYNRIQNITLQEGVISRLYGLAKIEIFTAGESSSDINIPGIEKLQAENIKQLLMGKIQKEL